MEHSSILNKYKLSNGLEFLFKPMLGHKFISIAIGIKNGVLCENKNGLAHLVEHLIGYSCEFYIKKFSKVWGSLSWTFDANIYKGYSEFRFDTKAFSFVTLMKIISYAFQNPAFNGKNILRERKNIIKEWRAQRNLDYYLADWLVDKAIFRAPFSNTPGGNPSEIRRAKKSDIIAYWKKIFKGGNIVIVVAGDIPENAIQEIRKFWSLVPRGKKIFYPSRVLLKKKRKRITFGFLPQKRIFVSIKIPVFNWRFYKKFVSHLISFAFAGATTSTLDKAFRHLTINKSLGASIFEFQKTAYLGISFYSPREKLMPVLITLMKSWLKFCEEGPSGKILKSVKSIARRLYKETIASSSLTAQMILYEKMYTLSGKQELLPEHRLELMLRVTKDEIREAAKAFAEVRDWSVVLVGNLRENPIKLFWEKISKSNIKNKNGSYRD